MVAIIRVRFETARVCRAISTIICITRIIYPDPEPLRAVNCKSNVAISVYLECIVTGKRNVSIGITSVIYNIGEEYG